MTPQQKRSLGRQLGLEAIELNQEGKREEAMIKSKADEQKLKIMLAGKSPKELAMMYTLAMEMKQDKQIQAKATLLQAQEAVDGAQAEFAYCTEAHKVAKKGTKRKTATDLAKATKELSKKQKLLQDAKKQMQKFQSSSIPLQPQEVDHARAPTNAPDVSSGASAQQIADANRGAAEDSD